MKRNGLITPTILALDLERTLISNAVSCFPRPGLYEFLVSCKKEFSRVVLFTTVPEPRARDCGIAGRGRFSTVLVADIELVSWPRSEKTKNLARGEGEGVGGVLLFDDQECCIHPGQKGQWVPVQEFLPPFSREDLELDRVRQCIEQRIAAAGILDQG